MALQCPQCQGILEMYRDSDHDIGDGYYVKEDYECNECHNLFAHVVKVSSIGRSDDWFMMEKDRRMVPVGRPLQQAA